MPWSETTPMRERIRFWQDYERGIFEFKELCELYGISRKTGYKLIGRILEEGLEQGIRDRPRVARSCPHRTEECLEDALVEIRRLHPRWGRGRSWRSWSRSCRSTAGRRRVRWERS
jgi:putative transposase